MKEEKKDRKKEGGSVDEADAQAQPEEKAPPARVVDILLEECGCSADDYGFFSSRR